MVQSPEPGQVGVVGAPICASTGQVQPGLQALIQPRPLEGALSPLTAQLLAKPGRKGGPERVRMPRDTQVQLHLWPW